MNHEAIAQRRQIVNAMRDRPIAEIAAATGFSKSYLYKLLPQSKPEPQPEPSYGDPFYGQRAIKVAADLAGANAEQLLMDWRDKPLVHARWAVMVCMRRRNFSFTQIGRRLHRDHTSVMYGVERAQYMAERLPELAEMIELVDAA